MMIRRKVRIACIRIVWVICAGAGVLFLLHTSILSVRSISIETRTITVEMYAEKHTEALLEQSYVKVPARGILLFLHKPIEREIAKHKAVRAASVSWRWFNVLHITIEEHIPFGFFCTHGTTVYKGDCHILNKEGVSFAGGRDYPRHGLIHFSHNNPNNEEFLPPHEFAVLVSVVDILKENGIRVIEVEAERHGAESTVLTVHTLSGAEIYINPHKEVETVFVLDNALRTIEHKEENGFKDIVRLNIYDTSRITYWRKTTGDSESKNTPPDGAPVVPTIEE